jgi:hypothetical protein
VNWLLAYRADPRGRALADRHYSRRRVGARQFVPPGRCVVLVSAFGTAVWVTSWQLPEYTRHAWAGAWVNSLFRRERSLEDDTEASEMIRAAVAVTRSVWPTVPTLGMVSFVDPSKLPGIPRRAHRCEVNCGRTSVFGYSYERAGFHHVGFTAGGLWVWQMRPSDMPSPMVPLIEQGELAWGAMA